MPTIYHITHVENLPRIIATGGLWSDRRMIAAGGGHTVIGFNHIKLRRLNQIAVPCHPGTTVGDFVPFYFCPRSIMLFLIEKRSAELAYKGGQREIVHLVSSVEAAMATGRSCAFTATNAGAFYTDFHSDVTELDRILDWEAIRADQWRDPAVKERKQAEFLVRDEFPWTAVEAIGTFSADVRARAERALVRAAHRPTVAVQRPWYY